MCDKIETKEGKTKVQLLVAELKGENGGFAPLFLLLFCYQTQKVLLMNAADRIQHLRKLGIVSMGMQVLKTSIPLENGLILKLD